MMMMMMMMMISSMMTTTIAASSSSERHRLSPCSHSYIYNAFNVHLSQGIRWQRVTLHAAAGMGVYTEGCSDISLDECAPPPKFTTRFVFHSCCRYVVKPRLPTIPMSLNADALHFSNTRGGAIRWWRLLCLGSLLSFEVFVL